LSHQPDSIREETSATGQRVTGAIKDATGEVTGNERLEEEGERENQAGKRPPGGERCGLRVGLDGRGIGRARFINSRTGGQEAFS